MSVLSQTAQQKTALLFHVSLLLGRQQIISYSLFPNLSWLAWKEIPEPACHTYCKTRHLTHSDRTVAMCCVFHFLNTNCSISSTSAFSAAAWVPHGLASPAPDRSHFRFNGHRTPLQTMTERHLPFHLALLGPSISRSRSCRIKLLPHLGCMFILAGFTHSSNICHNKTDIYKNLSHLY